MRSLRLKLTNVNKFVLLPGNDPVYRIYMVAKGNKPQCVDSPEATLGTHRNWTRKEIAHWLMDKAEKGHRFIAGID